MADVRLADVHLARDYPGSASLCFTFIQEGSPNTAGCFIAFRMGATRTQILDNLNILMSLIEKTGDGIPVQGTHFSKTP